LKAQQIREALDREWAKGPRKVDWLRLEQLLVDILTTPYQEGFGFGDDVELCASELVRACKEAIDAHTRRGHFEAEEYFPTGEVIE
jgi:hypothetical protein